MGAKALREVTVVADVAQSRETPVAFSNISVAKLEEELASQDLPMVLNSTPGVYATQQGGGDGDAREIASWVCRSVVARILRNAHERSLGAVSVQERRHLCARAAHRGRAGRV